LIQLNDKTFVPFINKKTIAAAINRIAHEISRDMQGETPIFIGVLNGAFVVVSDLVRAYPNTCEVSFVKMASYEGTKSTGKVNSLIGINENIEGRIVILVEDIVDTGNTLAALYEIFAKEKDVLKDKYNLVHISTGDVFRYNIKNATELGTLAKSYMDKGQLVPDKVTINMLKAEVESHEGANGFIFDGFPRTEAQAEALEKLLEEKNTKISAMVALEVDDEVLVQRLLERGKTSGRPDDADKDIIKNRIKVYYNETAILKNYYHKQNKYFGVNGVGSIEEITKRLSDVIDGL